MSSPGWKSKICGVGIDKGVGAFFITSMVGADWP